MFFSDVLIIVVNFFAKFLLLNDYVTARFSLLLSSALLIFSWIRLSENQYSVFLNWVITQKSSWNCYTLLKKEDIYDKYYLSTKLSCFYTAYILAVSWRFHHSIGAYFCFKKLLTSNKFLKNSKFVAIP